MKKASLKGKANEILTACPLFVICIHVPALHQCYMTNALGFSQSEARKFFMYIITRRLRVKFWIKLPIEMFVALNAT